MKQKSLDYAKYWRICLADAALGVGGLKQSDLEKHDLRPATELQNGRVGDALCTEFFKNEEIEVNEIEVTLRPQLYGARLEHGKKRASGVPEFVTPIVSRAVMDRKGRLFPSNNTVVPRDILEPLDERAFSIGSVQDLDDWLADHPVPTFDKDTIGERDFDEWHGERWQAYLNHCNAMLTAIASDWPDITSPFQLDERWAIVKDDSVEGASRHIVPLYDHIRAQNPSSALFDRFASETTDTPEVCLAANAGFSLRLGHASNIHPLAEAQRDALTHQLVAKHGEILGVNGPPGTGKTTMLLSVVASQWVRAALEESQPPVIAAASTNNQAVTNIIDAFEKDFSSGTGPFAGRWLPDIKSFGAYLPSALKEKESTGKYQTRSFFETVESRGYFERAKSAFLETARNAFSSFHEPSVNDVRAELHALICDADKKLKAMESVWPVFQETVRAMQVELGPSPMDTLAKRQDSHDAKQRDFMVYKASADKWDEYLARESWIFTLLSWIPPINQKRVLSAKIFLKRHWPDILPDRTWSKIVDFSGEINAKLSAIRTEFAVLVADLERGTQVIARYREAETQWAVSTDCLGMVLPPASRTLAACDKAADTSIRFPAFLHATHYWEARWLLEMEKTVNSLEEEKRKTGAATAIKRWRRRMMLTPCIVSTFFMLPKEFSVQKHERGQFIPDYLYDFIDLLIVDEAGQVLPEVAGASFSLAKRALVIGDRLQIEPIWNINEQVDIGNLMISNLLGPANVKTNYNRISELGVTAASGSVMEIAQRASRYHYDVELARGMFLYEHRRCYDEIVAYCNALCYHNKLIPKRGPLGLAAGLPAMGYLHIAGQCESRSGSRANLLEAETIAQWIAHHRVKLESQYCKPIDQILGIVTPFTGQAQAISRACEAHGILVGKAEGELTVGTVHALQGAERSLVIFSPTYSRDSDGGFIDRRSSMLNVAVSRAKDHFLVFGDTSLFDPANIGSPRGLLASFLFADPKNDIDAAR
jgi:AAA domain